MRQAIKKTAAYILVICTLLSLMVPLAFAAEAETKEYSFDYNPPLSYTKDVSKIYYFDNYMGNEQAINDAYAAGTLNSTYYMHDVSNGGVEPAAGSYPVYSWEGMFFRANVGDWVAMKIKSPGAGRWNIVLRYFTIGNSGYVKTHILDADATQAEITAAIQNGVTKEVNTKNSLNAEQQTVLDDFIFEEGKEYTVVFHASKTNKTSGSTAWLLLSGMTMTKSESIAASVTSNGATAYYPTVDEAIAAAAAASSTAVLLDDVTVDSVSVSANATLDLNGHTLTATTVTTNKDSHIVDNSEGDTGLLVMTNNAIFSTNKELPLYDSAKGGYRFFDVTVKSLGITGTEKNKFWFCVSFTNSDAYTLAASQMDIGAGLTATEITTETAAWAGEEFTGKWVTAVTNKEASDICFTAKNFSELNNFELTPMVKANGVTVSGEGL